MRGKYSEFQRNLRGSSNFSSFNFNQQANLSHKISQWAAVSLIFGVCSSYAENLSSNDMFDIRRQNASILSQKHQFAISESAEQAVKPRMTLTLELNVSEFIF